ACLLGEWVNLNNDSDSLIEGKSPYIWYEEGADVYSPEKRNKYGTYYELDYVHIYFKGKDYRINPIFIQIVTD
ncbi:hypothetical protein, partial [Sebaldella sp. S0638]|uniref:hypothetical protein n=1 Tax=Sebaldella sp. S0638 TaxID=2957809 RepID=UPI00209FC982